jgi:hypothetical protein
MMYWRDLFVKKIVRKGTASVRGGNGDECCNANGERLKVRQHISGVKTAHAVCDDGDSLWDWSVRFERGAESGGAIGNRRRWRDGGSQNGDALRGEGIANPMPVFY